MLTYLPSGAARAASGTLAGDTPGYGDPVIFASGTFIAGSTAELSADGPLRPPWVVYCQGGAHCAQWAAALRAALPQLPAPLDAADL